MLNVKNDLSYCNISSEFFQTIIPSVDKFLIARSKNDAHQARGQLTIAWNNRISGKANTAHRFGGHSSLFS